jgi:hypothetical protein
VPAASPGRCRDVRGRSRYPFCGWRKRLGVEPSLPASGQQPVLKTGRATGPRSLPLLSGLCPEPRLSRGAGPRSPAAAPSRAFAPSQLGLACCRQPPLTSILIRFCRGGPEPRLSRGAGTPEPRCRSLAGLCPFAARPCLLPPTAPDFNSYSVLSGLCPRTPLSPAHQFPVHRLLSFAGSLVPLL